MQKKTVHQTREHISLIWKFNATQQQCYVPAASPGFFYRWDFHISYMYRIPTPVPTLLANDDVFWGIVCVTFLDDSGEIFRNNLNIPELSDFLSCQEIMLTNPNSRPKLVLISRVEYKRHAKLLECSATIINLHKYPKTWS